jgi:putative flippase GtrA
MKTMLARNGPLARQFATFSGVGVIAAVAHFGVLIALVEATGMDAVRAALAGYVAGGVVSYVLNRRLTYRSDRPHREATWRFAIVAVVGFFLTWLLMAAFIRGLGFPYLPAQLVTTGIVLFWSFAANKVWTFAAAA